MERIQAVVGGLILQRNREDLHNLISTHEINKLLQNAAVSMPAQWWLTPDAASIVGSDANAFSETIRTMTQFTHYHLLAQLHLPYFLQPFTDRRCDYSKITAVNASREILSRFVFFRGSDTIAAYCRGVDFLAFIASTTLCLAHIDARRQYRVGMNNCATVCHLLAHQWLSDRGLMERTLLSMENMVKDRNDALDCKIASVIQRLLTIEAAAANDYSFKTSVSPEFGEQEFPCGDNMNEGDDALSIEIPYFGTIKIEHEGLLKYAEVEETSLRESAGLNSSSKASHSGARRFFEPNSPANRERRSPQGGESSSVTCTPGARIDDQTVSTNWQTLTSHLDSMTRIEGSHSTTINKEFSHVSQSQLGEEDTFIPGLAAGIDDWALQGVDMALFDSLIRGSGDPDPTITK